MLSLESSEKQICLNNFAKKQKLRISGDYWTSGTDQNCPDKFHWCSAQKNFLKNEIRWKSGHPDPNFDCVMANFNSSLANFTELATANCSVPKKFVCEIRQKNTARLALQEECAALWNVTPEEILLFQLGLAGTASYSYRLKCFIRCIGIEVGMFADNALVTDEILRKMEIAANDDPPTLQTGFNAFDDCSPLRNNDECITASEIYKCGLQKAPLLTNSMVNEGSTNLSVYGPPLDCVPIENYCFATGVFPCVLNSTKRTMLLNGNHPDLTYYINGTPGISYALSRNFRYENLSYPDAFNHCCSVGMRLAHPISATELSRLNSIMFTNGFNEYLPLVGDMFKLNQTHNAWCETGKVVDDSLYDIVGPPASYDNQNYNPDCYVYAYGLHYTTRNLAKYALDAKNIYGATGAPLFFCQDL
ncbi:uncharacterized protein LOC132201014 [Neocloeon triangulifer]|uniref:uncharacterized protein LOC132201014 n=1 Tax=Neocloeon triangulifer TaxID=2078957 RepID=UPI00286F6131|nr:uncharacterized protein LOC132201014 [Neocloeon triangulifer]